MSRSSRVFAALAAVLSTLLPIGSAATPAHADDPTGPSGEMTPVEVVHRVVWDAARRHGPATKIMSAERDGSDKVLVYRRDKGFVLDLTLDRQGDRVAMAPFTGRRPAQLIVASVDGSGHTNLLADTRRFFIIGGIGWSPNGRRLVFEADILKRGDHPSYLWTIHADGTHLRRLMKLDEPNQNQPAYSNSLSWTKRGIYFIAPDGLTLLDREGTHLLVGRVWTQHVSGNGRWLIVERYMRHISLWRLRPDGGDLQRIVGDLRPNRAMGYLTESTPNFSGRRLLTVADGFDNNGTVWNIVHPSDRAPRRSDPRLDFMGGAYTVTWN